MITTIKIAIPMASPMDKGFHIAAAASTWAEMQDISSTFSH